VIDALCWHDVDPGVLDGWSHLREWRQMLIRALIYRIATTEAAGGDKEPEEAYFPVVRRVIAFRE
jgi:hypothetical protein